MTPAQVRDAMDRCPPELHRLLFWLVAGCVERPGQGDGTA
jgi:hypothetical protein